MRYDYKCPSCGFIKEVSHGMNESPVVKCDKCGSIMRKIISFNGNFFIKNKLGDFRRYHIEGKERADARNNFMKKHPYEPVPKDLL